jgi:hypothetical protein
MGIGVYENCDCCGSPCPACNTDICSDNPSNIFITLAGTTNGDECATCAELNDTFELFGSPSFWTGGTATTCNFTIEAAISISSFVGPPCGCQAILEINIYNSSLVLVASYFHIVQTSFGEELTPIICDGYSATASNTFADNTECVWPSDISFSIVL